MNTLILIAGAAALAATGPALANPGQGHGQKGNAHAQKSNAKAHGYAKHGKHLVATRNGGRLYALDARGSCPPGLAKKNNGCLPPGQAKKLYDVGQRYNRNFGDRWSYDQIPMDLRSRYSFDQDDRYYYRNGYLYQVDPRTMLVERVVSALLR
jgi:outer membrane protein assembly factor BamB